MKNYFNAKERTNHIVVLAMSELLKDFAKSNALTEEETEDLLTAEECLRDVTKSIFKRFGDGYKRKIEGTLEINTIRLVSKFGQENNCISYISMEDIKNSIKDVMYLNCLACEKSEYKNCPVYNIGVACELEGKDTSDCPYKW